MTIEQVDASVVPGRNDYAELFAVLRANPGNWYRIPLAELTGKSPNNVRSSMQNTAKKSGLKLRFRLPKGEQYIYVRAAEVQS